MFRSSTLVGQSTPELTRKTNLEAVDPRSEPLEPRIEVEIEQRGEDGEMVYEIFQDQPVLQ